MPHGASDESCDTKLGAWPPDSTTSTHTQMPYHSPTNFNGTTVVACKLSPTSKQLPANHVTTHHQQHYEYYITLLEAQRKPHNTSPLCKH